MTKILDGRVVRDQIAQVLSSKFQVLSPRPKLVIIQVGDLAESNTYIRQKILFGQKIGAIVEHQKLPADISQAKLVRQLSIVNCQLSTHGIIVQLPIPDHVGKDVINAIDPQKDVDGQTATNIKLLFEGQPETIPATTRGILTLLDYYKIPVAGKKVVVVGRSSLVGKPTALAFLNRDATVTICHSKTRQLSLITRDSDILIVAAGRPKLITKDHVRKGQVVIDVGINVVKQAHLRGEIQTAHPRGFGRELSRIGGVEATPEKHPGGVNALAHLESEMTLKPETEPQQHQLVGDVDFDNVAKIVAAISPVPGGCGPMTVVSLFENLLVAYQRQT